MKKFIIITTIYPPSEAIKEYSKKNNYELVVVGDKKSPNSWNCNGTVYLSVVDQEKMGFSILNELPHNHYSRKMIGYLYAIKNESEIIIDTDDDNIPKDNWGFPKLKGNFEYFKDNQGFINIYQAFTKQKIWPRGLPLNLINTNYDFSTNIEKKECNIGIWQGLADEDPDVDAIYRLTNDSVCSFEDRNPIVLGKQTICPFNTQNTLIRKELFPLLYLPTYVTFRFTDILRGLIAQPIMWLYDYHLGFFSSTVYQKRNPHDYFLDFKSEIPMYIHSDSVIEIVSKNLSRNFSINDNLYNAYNSLLKTNIVEKQEMVTLEAWLNDIIS